MTPLFAKEDLRQRVRWYITLRWFLVVGLGLSGLVPQYLQEGLVAQVQQNLGIILIVLGLNGIFLFFSLLRNVSYGVYHTLAIAQLVLDLSIVTGVLHLNGGIESVAVTLYVIPIIMAGALLGRWAVYATGFTAAALYDTMGILDYLHIVVPENILAPYLHTNTNYVIQTLVFASAMLLAITIITDFVSKFVRERTELGIRLNTVLAQQAEIEAIIRTMGSALVAIDTDGKITTINNAFERLTGWQRREVVGKDLDTILPMLDEHGKRLKQDKRPLLRLLHTNPRTHNIQRITRYYYAKRDGSIFPFVGSLAQITIGDNVLGATSVFEDASSIKQIDQLKTNFIAMASHQLKTPLVEIKGYTENMLDGLTGKLNKDQRKYIASIKEITTRSNKLIADLLDASVLEQGTISVDIESVKLSEILKKVLHIYHARTKQKSITVTVHQPSEEIVVRADRDGLVEVIGNVMANAVSYTKKNTTITIETEKQNGFGVILITDEGKGMDKKVLENLFQKDDILSSAPEAEGGTGIGLYLAKQLLSLQQGEISVVSSTNKGTTIAIKVPLKLEGK